MSSELPSSTPETGPPSPPQRSLIWWALLLPLALLIGVLWQMGREPREPPAPIAENRVAAPKPRKATPQAKTKPQPHISVKAVIFVPDDDARLQRRVVEIPELNGVEMPTAPSRYDSVVSTRALNILFKKVPDVFPAGTATTQLVDVPDISAEKDVIRVSLNRKFQNSDFWSNEKITELAIAAIVNTVAANQTHLKQARVQILVEGKPIQTLGEFDVSEPIEPDMSLVAKD